MVLLIDRLLSRKRDIMQKARSKTNVAIGYAAARFMQLGGLCAGLYGSAKIVAGIGALSAEIAAPAHQFMSSFAGFQSQSFSNVEMIGASAAAIMVGEWILHRLRSRRQPAAVSNG